MNYFSIRLIELKNRESNSQQKGQCLCWLAIKRLRAYKAARQRRRERCRNDKAYRLTHLMRSRVRQAVKAAGARKCTRTMALVGCSTVRAGHAVRQPRQVHIDHIRPCVSFNLAHASDQRVCFHFTNMQPL